VNIIKRNMKSGARVLLVATLTLVFTLVGQGIDVLSGLDQAQAQSQGRKQRIALFVLPQKGTSTEVSTVIQTLVRQQLAELEQVRVLTGSPDPITSVAAKLRSEVENAYRALNDRKYAGSLGLFQTVYQAIIRYEGPFEQRLMARTVKGLAVSLAATGNTTKAKEMMRTGFNLWPGQAAGDYAYTLAVQNLFKEVEKEFEGAAAGKIDIVSEPPGAVVRVNGTVKGYTPYTVEEAPAGPSWVSVQLDGHIRQGTFVDVASGKMAGHGFALQPVRNEAAYKTLMRNVWRTFTRERKVGTALEDLRTFLRADGIIFLQLTARRSYALKGWYVGATPNAIPLRGSFNPGATLLKDIQSWLAQSLNRKVEPTLDPLPLDAPPQASVIVSDSDMIFIDPNDPILQTKKAEVADPITGKWWFWAIIGGATASVAGMVAVMLGEQGKAKGPVGDLTIRLYNQ
jgi:hypothetical protein